MRASRRDAKVSRHETWRILGVVAALALLTPVGSRAATTASPAAPPTAKAATVTPTPAKTTAATATTATKTAPAASARATTAATPVKTTPAAPVKTAPSTVTAKAVTTVKPNSTLHGPATSPNAVVAARPAKVTSAPNVAVAAKPSEIVPVRNPKATAVQSAPSIEEQVTYQYNALGRRDPFQPMIGGTFVGDDVGGDAPPDVGGMKVVGIVWGANDKFALVEDGRGQSTVLRAGDKVMNGVVETLKRDAVIVNLTVDGQTESVTIPLTRKGDQTNANR